MTASSATTPEPKGTGEIGFVVIGRNEGDRLRECLHSILRESDRIIYADSCSDDDSVELARTLGAVVVELDPGTPTTAARGRNEGFQTLMSVWPDCRYVQFIDGDCVLAKDWLSSARDFMDRSPKAALCCGRRYERHPDASFYNWLMDQEWDTPVGMAKACGGDAFARTDAIAQVGGYRADLSAGEEPEMCLRLRAEGWQIWRIGLPMSEHDARLSRFGQWWMRSIRSGFGYAQLNRATAPQAERLYGRNLRSAIMWAGLFPAMALIATAITRSATPFILLVSIYGFQIARMAGMHGLASRKSWQRATLSLVSKFAELIGALRFLVTSRTQTFDYRARAQKRPA